MQVPCRKASPHGYQVPAAVIEFIHTATLLHDDVVDESELRRGRQTANDLWGNAASVLVGDFLYSRAFQMMARKGLTHPNRAARLKGRLNARLKAKVAA